MATCTECGGTGSVPCPHCRGKGGHSSGGPNPSLQFCSGCRGTGQAKCRPCGGTGTPPIQEAPEPAREPAVPTCANCGGTDFAHKAVPGADPGRDVVRLIYCTACGIPLTAVSARRTLSEV